MINVNSPTQLSYLLFGGTIEEECQVPILNELGIQEIYKTGEKRGQLKFKKGFKAVYMKGLGIKPHSSWKTKKPGVYQTNEAVLAVIAESDNKEGAEIAKLMLEIRYLEKLMGTYFEGFEKLIYKHDSCIHGSLNHVQTDTGRTSSSKPNLQNIPG